jgi:two-component system invasion response regulator UvrY
MKKTVRILVVDDHAIVRAGMKQFVTEESDMEVTGEAGSAAEAIAKLRANTYDVVLLDISLPDRSGVDLLKQIKRDWPQLPVLVMSMHPEDRYAVQLLRAGASGYMPKEAAPDQLVAALRTVLEGRRYISLAVAELLATELDRHEEGPPHAALSDRERQIFERLARGIPPTKIADELALSVKTVSTYRTRILEKMGMKTNADLTYYAVKNGLID